MKEVERYINKKRRKKKIKRLCMTTTILVIILLIFITKAPIFNVKKIKIEGVAYLTQDSMLNIIKDRIGKNIFMLNINNIEKDIMSVDYVKSVKVKRSGFSTIKVKIEEESPVFYIKHNNIYKIINEDIEVVEETTDITGRNLVEIRGIDKLNDKKLGVALLKKIYPYISKNLQELSFDAFDISEISNIKGYMGQVTIVFGDDSNLYDKMENVYRIMLDEKINLKKGYINLTNNDAPVIKQEKN